MRAKGGLARVGGTVWNLKRRWNGKEGSGNKDFKKDWGKLGQGVGALKGGGAGTLLKNMGHGRLMKVILNSFLF